MYENIRELRNNMRDNDTIITSFLYEFNNVRCIVIVNDIRAQGLGMTSPYALLQLILIKRNDINTTVTLEVNVNGICDLDVRSIREFFEVEFSNELGSFIQDFKESMASSIPRTINENPNNEQREIMISQLSQADAEDPSKIYCFGVRRNPYIAATNERGTRSVFNSEKTKMLRPDLYNIYGEDMHISFMYSNDVSRERTDQEIMEDFADRV